MKRFHWTQLFIGIWILISPWVLGFASINIALWSNTAAGILILIISLWLIFGEDREI